MSDSRDALRNLPPEQLLLLKKRLKEAKEAATGGESLSVLRDDDNLPLSFAQLRIWWMGQLASESTLYNTSDTLYLTGPLDISTLEYSIDKVVHRHEVLRTTFEQINEEPRQRIHERMTVPLSVIDLFHLSPAQHELEIQRTVDALSRQPMDLQHGPLLQLYLLRLGAQSHVFHIVVHHIVTDSMDVFIQDLFRYYEAAMTGQPPALPKLTMQYADFAIRQRQRLTGSRAAALRDYWRARLADAPSLLELPTDLPRPPAKSYQGANYIFTLPPSLTDALKQLSRQTNLTLFATMLTGFQLLLYRYSGQEDFCLGTPISQRFEEELAPLVGLFTNNIVLRCRLDPATRFMELLQQVRVALLDVFGHADLPFEQLVDLVQPRRDLSYTPLFQVMFAMQEVLVSEQIGQIQLSRRMWADSGQAKFDLLLYMWERPEGLTGLFEYSTDLFKEEMLAHMASHFETLLTAIVDDPKQRLDAIPLLTESERHYLLTAQNQTESDCDLSQTVLTHFEEVVRCNPDRLALVSDEEQLTYAQLNSRANQLAWYLRSQGVGPDVVVGVCVERSVEMVVALLGILKAGGAYLPLGVDLPPGRLNAILRDSSAALLLIQQRFAPLLHGMGHRIFCLDSSHSLLDAMDESNVPQESHPANLAYVIYTSGSTGQPKGVMNTQEAILNRLLWMQRRYGLGATDCVLQKTPFTFDVSVWEFFWPLMVGARLALAAPDGHKDPAYLRDVILRHQVSCIHFVPSMLHFFVRQKGVEVCQSLRYVICSGEELPYMSQELFFARFPATELHNLYGPTEAAIDVSSWECQRATEPQRIPIGYPIDNSQLYVLDDRMEPVPSGVSGELYIGGVGLARGYLKRPELTAARFVPNPFGEAGSRLYQTGDLARYRADGALEFLGRRDSQVKLRGLRIELEEIEHTLRQHAAVSAAVVSHALDESGGQLIAYLVARPPHALSPSTLREFLRHKLPEYMIPARFVFMDAFPLTSSGKIDRHHLPLP
ncbi:MAG: amino acid adenylation domain-containing protein, partial [Ardenticatenales bacterium]|nr:amino acid adenylation domain-containing protein [Ardenticatenales bacterium]